MYMQAAMAIFISVMGMDRGQRTIMEVGNLLIEVVLGALWNLELKQEEKTAQDLLINQNFLLLIEVKDQASRVLRKIKWDLLIRIVHHQDLAERLEIEGLLLIEVTDQASQVLRKIKLELLIRVVHHQGLADRLEIEGLLILQKEDLLKMYPDSLIVILVQEQEGHLVQEIIKSLEVINHLTGPPHQEVQAAVEVEAVAAVVKAEVVEAEVVEVEVAEAVAEEEGEENENEFKMFFK
jgi:hypothetical protein